VNAFRMFSKVLLMLVAYGGGWLTQINSNFLDSLKKRSIKKAFSGTLYSGNKCLVLLCMNFSFIYFLLTYFYWYLFCCWKNDEDLLRVFCTHSIEFVRKYGLIVFPYSVQKLNTTVFSSFHIGLLNLKVGRTLCAPLPM